jgi:DNA repair ATPase RecN
MEGVMFDNNRKILKSIIWIEFRYFNIAKAKLAKHADELMELFDKISIKNINTESFDERVKEIISLQRKYNMSITF